MATGDKILQEKNVLIEASAGTGKTYNLVERLVYLLKSGVAPREIVALTFSRAAAGEIFARFVRRLAEDVKKNADPKAAARLRCVLETQHLTQMGTLDSFLMRFVQSFPLELGLSGDISVLGEYAHKGAQKNAARALFRRSDGETKRAFTEAFAQAMNHRALSSFEKTFTAYMKDWHETYLAYPEGEAWGNAARIWAEPPPELAATLEEIHASVDALEGNTGAGVQTFVNSVRGFSGKLPDRFPVKLRDDPTAKRAWRLMIGFLMAHTLERTRGFYNLLHLLEAEYDRRVRTRGQLTFGDIPRLVARLPIETRLALEFRLDAHIRQWALDEFQDTSREQWNALRNLVDEASQNDEKGVFVVGDCKQAIYGWRNGDVKIFQHMRDNGVYVQKPLNTSFRYGPEIADAVTNVFQGRSLQAFGKWNCPKHEVDQSVSHGFVHVVEAGDSHTDPIMPFIQMLGNELLAVRPWERGITCAVLVRSNTFGEKVGEALRDMGVPATWEGESDVLDTPVLRAFTAYVKLAEHPADTLSYGHLFSTPLGRALYPQEVAAGTPPSPETVSRDALDALTTRGLGRTFQELRSKLPVESFDAFTECRFADMLRAASAFESTLEPGTRLTTFIDYLQDEHRRDWADATSVKVMTIHRSKGLGFDYVLLPLYEYRGMDAAREGTVLVGPNPEAEKPDWVLPNPSEEVLQAFPELNQASCAAQDAQCYEALCVYYVAMTRAKRALTLILSSPTKGESKTTKFSAFVRDVNLKDCGDPKWYQAFPLKTDTDASQDDEKKDIFAEPAPTRLARRHLTRRRPSKDFHTGMRAGDLFVSHAGRVAAMERGTEVHAQYAQIAWLEPEDAHTPLEHALVRPENSIDLWRERAYELCHDGVWESGQFDRVVFTRDDAGAVTATIYDFKTNARGASESDAAFAARMRTLYTPQMTAYRRALNRLTGIPEERILTVLLLDATGQALTL